MSALIEYDTSCQAYHVAADRVRGMTTVFKRLGTQMSSLYTTCDATTISMPRSHGIPSGFESVSESQWPSFAQIVEALADRLAKAKEVKRAYTELTADQRGQFRLPHDIQITENL